METKPIHTITIKLTSTELKALTYLLHDVAVEESYKAKEHGLDLEQWNTTPQCTSLDKVLNKLTEPKHTHNNN